MTEGSNIAKLGVTLNGMAKSHVKVQTYWATAKNIDWANKTMIATAVIDGLDFYDVALGVGFLYLKPKEGTMCLLGLIENQDAATFLITADEVEEAAYKSGESELTIKDTGFILKQGDESFKAVLNDLETEVGKLADELAKVVVLIGTGPNVAAITAIKAKVIGNIKTRTNQIFAG